MSYFLRNKRCPNCENSGRDRAGDNLGVFSDGHKFCWSCGWTERGGGSFLSLEELRKRHLNNNKNEGTKSDVPCLPFDFTTDIPEIAQEWLDKYEITDEEVYRYKLGWSEYDKRLYFPIYDEEGKLILLQGRYYGHDPKQPRYRTSGKSRDILTILPKKLSTKTGDVRSNRIICCEDMLSGIKIARVENAWVLFGSNLASTALLRMSKQFGVLGIWLDRDKLKTALKAQIEASWMFDEVFVISSEKDPKCYSTEEIEEWILKASPR